MQKLSQECRRIMKDMGKRLRFERIIRNLSQEEMAYLLNISDRQLRRYEKGEIGIPLFIMNRLYWEYSIDLNYLVTGEFPEDYSVARAAAIMPQEMFDTLIAPVKESVEKMEKGQDLTDDEIETDLAIFGILARYGIVHKDDEKIREPLHAPCFLLYHIVFAKPVLPMDYMPPEEELDELLQKLMA